MDRGEELGLWARGKKRRASVRALARQPRYGQYAVAPRQSLPAIVHDDHFKIPPGLLGEGFQEALPESRVRR